MKEERKNRKLRHTRKLQICKEALLLRSNSKKIVPKRHSRAWLKSPAKRRRSAWRKRRRNRVAERERSRSFTTIGERCYCSAAVVCKLYERDPGKITCCILSLMYDLSYATLKSMTSEFFYSIVILVSRLAKRSDNPYMVCKCGLLVSGWF